MARATVPVALFAHRRPEHLAASLAALRENPLADQTDLVIFCDGSRGPQDEDGVLAVRRVAAAASGFRTIQTIASPKNLGLAHSIIGGVDRMLEQSDRVIVLEDDLVVSPDFLRFMNDALEMYADDTEVVSIHGFSVATSRPMPQTYFLRGADCWGWATWRRGWQVFDPDSEHLLGRLRQRGLASTFDLGGAYPYTDMLERQARGDIDSWAIRWHASAFLANMLTLYPGRSLVENIGQEGSGTHSVRSDSHASSAHRFEFPLERIEIGESVEARAEVVRVLGREHAPLLARISLLLRQGRR